MFNKFTINFNNFNCFFKRNINYIFLFYFINQWTIKIKNKAFYSNFIFNYYYNKNL